MTEAAAVILLGGLGPRFLSVRSDIPKPMAPIVIRSLAAGLSRFPRAAVVIT